jgi:hypothetical protein
VIVVVIYVCESVTNAVGPFDGLLPLWCPTAAASAVVVIAILAAAVEGLGGTIGADVASAATLISTAVVAVECKMKRVNFSISLLRAFSR